MCLVFCISYFKLLEGTIKSGEPQRNIYIYTYTDDNDINHSPIFIVFNKIYLRQKMAKTYGKK